jgi:hypothetical protein
MASSSTILKSFTSTIIHHTIINPPDQNQYQPIGKSKSTHRKSKSKSNPPEIKIKIKPTGNQNQNQPTGYQNQNQPHRKSKSKSTHRKSKSESNPPEIKIKINPPENKNKNQPMMSLLHRRLMVSTEIPETSHGFHRPAAGAPPVPLDDSFLGPAESRKRKAAM